jgi:carboxylate-amine ligase
VSHHTPNRPPTAAELRARFDAAGGYTVGIEDEVMVLDPDTLELAPRGSEVLELMGEDPRFKLELPAAQLEIVTAPTATVLEAAAALLDARRELVARTGDLARFAGAGWHPTSPGRGELNDVPRYARVIDDYRPVIDRQLVCALQVHVSVPGAERALAVYNTARAYMPWLAALAANAPFYEGRDSGLASVRPKVGELLPRQGIPPAFDSWEDYADGMAWGAGTGAFPDASNWWWDLRLHPGLGTLELRVPDGQRTVADAAGIAAVAQSLVAWLAERQDQGELESPAPTWRIEENRWWACRDGVEGKLADMSSGTLRSTRECLHELLDRLDPIAARLGAADALACARELVECNGALAQRRVAARAGIPAVPGWLASQFIRPWPR